MLRKVMFVLLASCAIFDAFFVQSMAGSRSIVTQILLVCIKFGILLAFYLGVPTAKKMFVVGGLGLAIYFVIIACGDYPVRLASAIYTRMQVDMSQTILRCLFVIGAVMLVLGTCILLLNPKCAEEQYAREVRYTAHQRQNKKFRMLVLTIIGIALASYVAYLIAPRTTEDIIRGGNQEEITGFSISILYEGANAGYDNYSIRASEASEKVVLLLECLAEQRGYWVPQPEALNMAVSGAERTDERTIVSVSIEPWYGDDDGGERCIHIYGNGQVYLDDYTGASVWRDSYRLSEEEIREVFAVVENMIQE